MLELAAAFFVGKATSIKIIEKKNLRKDDIGFEKLRKTCFGLALVTVGIVAFNKMKE